MSNEQKLWGVFKYRGYGSKYEREYITTCVDKASAMNTRDLLSIRPFGGWVYAIEPVDKPVARPPRTMPNTAEIHKNRKK
jgi:hypothetical protein